MGSSNKMVDNCQVCGQRTQFEPGFYFGTGYVSYALTVGFSIITFVSWVAAHRDRDQCQTYFLLAYCEYCPADTAAAVFYAMVKNVMAFLVFP